MMTAELNITTASGRRTMPQQDPTPGRENVFPVARTILTAMLDEAERRGIETYGTTLQTHNGRDAHEDAIEEMIDALVYVIQAAMEHRSLKDEIERLRQDQTDRIPPMVLPQVIARGYTTEVRRLEEQVAGLQEALQEAEAEIALYKAAQHDHAASDYHMLLNKLASWIDRCNKAEDGLKSARAEIAKLKAESMHEMDMFDALGKERDDLWNERDELARDLVRERGEAHDEIEKLRVAIQTWKANYAKLEGKNKRLSREVKRLTRATRRKLTGS